MGTGVHGDFGMTRYRLGAPVAPTEKTYEMSLSPELYANTISNKYNIHLKGSGKKIEIVFNPDIPHGIYGRTREIAPNIIEIGPDALRSEKELANTIAHELNHARSFLKGGRAPEGRARKAGNTLEQYIGGKR